MPGVIRASTLSHAGTVTALTLASAFALVASLPAQAEPSDGIAQDPVALGIDALHWREVGPYRGGRSCAVAGIPGDPDTFYMGTCGGGVWRTDDAGRSWRNLSDGHFGGSIGGIDVCAADPNVVWVGTGEETVRGNVSHGDGVWRSTDAGRTWKHVGLEDTRQIGRVRAHPTDPDVAFVAAMGHLYGPNDQRGVFRTSDGGETWQRVLYVDEEVGAVDLCLDPTNPRIVYATTWRVLRTPWTLEGGGPGSGMWKSTDGGETWTDITRNEGLPEGAIGICGIAVSRSDADNVYAMVEAEEGGLFRSRDGGKTWVRVDSDRERRQRAWYYTRLVADPSDAEVVWVLNVRLWRSKDGGKTFDSVSTPHGDNHDLWIDPTDARRMVEANDGGGNVSLDSGVTWSAQDNQPTAQMYRVSLDDDFPFRLLGGQQDNSALRIRSRNVDGAAIGDRDFEPTSGGESGHVVAQPGNPDLVFGGSYGGYLEWRDHRTGERRRVNPWPDSVLGWGAGDVAWRFQWNFPLFFSPHDPKRLYAAAQSLFRSDDLGQSWTVISPDLTRNDPDKMGPSGGPITKDNTGVEYYCTIFAACESPVRAGLLWCASDDGLLHLSEDGGKAWRNVTPPTLPAFTRINGIDPHPREAGTLYLAATRYQSDDFSPMLWRTRDLGGHWEDITGTGIPADHFTRAVRVDPERDGMLYAGTERGPYVSFDDGRTWRSLGSDLPIVPITDLVVRGDELVAATQGRGFWILNGLSTLRRLEGADPKVHLFPIAPAWRVGMRHASSPRGAGENPHPGLEIRYRLGAEPAADARFEVEIQTADGTAIERFERKKKAPKDSRDSRASARFILEPKAGMNRFVWDMHWPGARALEGLAMWNGNLDGPLAEPGEYLVVLRVGDVERRVLGEIGIDPRARAGIADYATQFAFLTSIVTKLDEMHAALGDARRLRTELVTLEKRVPESVAGEEWAKASAVLRERIDRLEAALCQPKSKSAQDPLNFPVGLNDRLAGLNRSSGGFGPTAQDLAVRDELFTRIEPHLTELRALLSQDSPALEARAREAGISVIR